MFFYEVFTERRLGEKRKHVGSVRGLTPELALQQAKEIYTRRDECERVTIVERSNPTHEFSTGESDIELFEIAFAKRYRQPSYFTARNGVESGKGLET